MTGTLTAQTKTAYPKPYIAPNDANACEVNSAYYDLLIQTILSGNERLFVIARLGRGESPDILRRRLHNVKSYFEGRLKPERITFTQGEKFEGEGRVEFYVGSELTVVSPSKRNADLCVSCCGEYDDAKYYGFGKIDKPKRKRRKT